MHSDGVWTLHADRGNSISCTLVATLIKSGHHAATHPRGWLDAAMVPWENNREHFFLLCKKSYNNYPIVKFSCFIFPISPEWISLMFPQKKCAALQSGKEKTVSSGSEMPLATSDERIGEDIRGLRKAKRMTLADLAHQINRSVAYLSKLERNLTKPSVTELQAVSTALGVKISFFFHETDAPNVRERKTVVRRSDRRKLHFADGITDYLLSPNLDGPLELLMSVFEPGSGSGESPYTHEGDEAGVVLSGELEFWVGEDHFVVEEGDSFSFKSTVPHRYVNKGTVKAVVIWVVTPPSY